MLQGEPPIPSTSFPYSHSEISGRSQKIHRNRLLPCCRTVLCLLLLQTLKKYSQFQLQSIPVLGLISPGTLSTASVAIFALSPLNPSYKAMYAPRNTSTHLESSGSFLLTCLSCMNQVIHTSLMNKESPL